MNNNNKDDVGFLGNIFFRIVLLSMVVGLFSMCVFTLVKDKMKKEAIAAGVAYYSVDNTGKVTFNYKTGCK